MDGRREAACTPSLPASRAEFIFHFISHDKSMMSFFSVTHHISKQSCCQFTKPLCSGSVGRMGASPTSSPRCNHGLSAAPLHPAGRLRGHRAPGPRAPSPWHGPVPAACLPRCPCLQLRAVGGASAVPHLTPQTRGLRPRAGGSGGTAPQPTEGHPVGGQCWAHPGLRLPAPPRSRSKQGRSRPKITESSIR